MAYLGNRLTRTVVRKNDVKRDHDDEAMKQTTKQVMDNREVSEKYVSALTTINLFSN